MFSYEKRIIAVKLLIQYDMMLCVNLGIHQGWHYITGIMSIKVATIYTPTITANTSIAQNKNK